jgi:hypothetical protein
VYAREGRLEELFDRMARRVAILDGHGLLGRCRSLVMASPSWPAVWPYLIEQPRHARAYTSVRSIGFCALWVCISSSSSSTRLTTAAT